MSLSNQLLDIEKQLWRNEAALYQFHVIEEALLAFPETGVITRSDAVEAIKTENAEGRRWADVRMEAIHSVQVTGDVAVLTYRVTARWEHEQSADTALASSLYVMRDGAWKLAFHQQTPVPGA
jgi:hypothetical protein